MRTRRGFTLIELMIALILLSIVGTVIMRLLTSSQRASRYQSEQALLQSNVRAGATLVPTELRELGISGAASDIYAGMTATQISYRAMRSTSVACAFGLTAIKLRNSMTFSYRALATPRDTLLVFVEGNPLSSADDAWMAVAITGGTSATTCPDGTAATSVPVVLTAPTIALILPSGVTEAPVRSFEKMQLQLYASGGQSWLGARSVSAGEATLQPVLGPLEATNGLQLDYLDANGTATAVPTAIRSINVTIRGLTDKTISRGTDALHVAKDTLVSRIRLRNAPRP